MSNPFSAPDGSIHDSPSSTNSAQPSDASECFYITSCVNSPGFKGSAAAFFASNSGALNGRVLKLESDVEGLKSDVKDLKSDVKDLKGEFEGFKKHVDTRFDALGTKFDALNTRFDALESLLAKGTHRPPSFYDAHRYLLSTVVFVWVMAITLCQSLCI